MFDMTIYYLKIAVRNLLKYKTQSCVSLFGLAVAFACVSLAVYWNHYELTYDAFQRNADRIYRIRHSVSAVGSVVPEVQSQIPVVLADYLMGKYPEVDKACSVKKSYYSIDGTINNIAVPADAHFMDVTPEALEMFDIEWIEGNRNIAGWNNNGISIAENIAKQVCGDISPIGMKLNCEGKEYEIVAVHKTWSQHSTLTFDIIRLLDTGKKQTDWHDIRVTRMSCLKKG